MRRTGWSANTLKAGDIIRITGNPTRDGSPMVSLEKGELVDPETKVANPLTREGGGNAQNALAVNAPLEIKPGIPNLSGSWANNSRKVRQGPPAPPDMKFNEAGAALQASYDLSTDAQVFCDPPGLVRQAGFTPHPIKITQHDDRVVFDYEEYGGHREVYFNPPPASGIKTHLGDSVAWYEDGALKIESKNLLSNLISPEGNRLSDQTTVLETYRRNDNEQDGAVLAAEIVVNDPMYLTAPVTMTKAKTLVEGYEMIKNECYAPLRERIAVSPYMSFFVTSATMKGELTQADTDTQCEALASTVSAGGREWRAYLGASDRERIGSGPWYNAKGVPVGINVDELHSEPRYLQPVRYLPNAVVSLLAVTTGPMSMRSARALPQVMAWPIALRQQPLPIPRQSSQWRPR